MRTTLDLDEDILGIARQLAAQRKQSAGRVISDLVRQALMPKKRPRMRNGIPQFEPKPGAKPPTLDLINQLRDEE
jgi:hypothetical protein